MSARAKDRTLYARAYSKKRTGKALSAEELYRLEQARLIREQREEATWKKDHARSLNEEGRVGPMFRVTRYGWRVTIPRDYPGGPWNSKDEIEVVTTTGKPVWITLVRLYFSGGGMDWWSYSHGRQSQVVRHIPPPLQANISVPEHKVAPSLLDEDDEDLATTVAGAAYLGARNRRRVEAEE